MSERFKVQKVGKSAPKSIEIPVQYKNRKYPEFGSTGIEFPVIAICARRGSGKSHLVGGLIDDWITNPANVNNRLIVFSATAETHDPLWRYILRPVTIKRKVPDNDTKREIAALNGKGLATQYEEVTIPNPRIKTYSDPSHFDEVVQYVKKKGPDEIACLVFDDFSEYLRDKDGKKLGNLVRIARHYQTIIILSFQSYTDILPAVRKNTNVFLLGRGVPQDTLSECFKDMAVTVPRETFYNMYKFATAEPYNFFYVNANASDYRKNFTEKIVMKGGADDEPEVVPQEAAPPQQPENVLSLAQNEPAPESKPKPKKEPHKFMDLGHKYYVKPDIEEEDESLLDKAKNFIDYFKHGRTRLDPKSRKVFNQYARQPIKGIEIIRAPIDDGIYQALDIFSKLTTKKSLNDFLKNQPYDKLFHISAVVLFKNGKAVTIEKNHIVEVHDYRRKTTKSKNRLYIPVPDENATLESVFDKTEKKIGQKAFWEYSATSTNCQHFLASILKYGFDENLYSPEAKAFITEAANELVKFLPSYSGKLAKFATLLADFADAVKKGLGENVVY